MPSSGEMWLQGRAVVPGIAFGSLYVLPAAKPFAKEFATTTSLSIEHEISRFSVALKESRSELQTLHSRLKNEGFSQEADLVDLHLQLTHDPELVFQVEKTIRERQICADCAVHNVLEQLRGQFQSIRFPFFRQRFEDIEGVCLRLLSLLSSKSDGRENIPAQAVLFAKTVTASVVAEANTNGLGAIVTTNGGAMSHTAIVAKARGIPYVTNISGATLHERFAGDSVIVDGLAGLVIVRPNKETVRKYKVLKKAHDTNFRSSARLLGAKTKDRHHIRLFGNVSGAKDAGQLDSFGIEGIGLYRTEFQILDRRRFPTEEEQEAFCSDVVRAAKGRPVVIRVFDFGSDKAWDEVTDTFPEIVQGLRTIDVLLRHPKTFLSHLQAIVRSAQHGPISVLFPMISSKQELLRCVEIFHEACRSVGLNPPRIGAMIELPSAALRVRELAECVDFLSIGTNDLTQYTLAVDRSNTASFDPLLSYHPGFLRVLHFIASEAAVAKKPLCVCGEAGTDPLLIPFLMGIGIKELSISPRMAPMVKHVIRAFTMKEVQEIAKKILQTSSAQEIYSYLQAQYCLAHGR